MNKSAQAQIFIVFALAFVALGSLLFATNTSFNPLTGFSVLNVVTTLTLNSTFGTNFTTENLTLYLSQTNPDSDNLVNITDWRVNGTSIAEVNLPFEGGSNKTYTKDYSTHNLTINVSAVDWNATGGHDGFGAYLFKNSTSTSHLSLNRTIKDDFTIMFWMKTNVTAPSCGSMADGYGLVSAEVGGVTNDFGINLCNDRVFFGIGNPERNATSKTNVTDNQWHFVAARRMRSTGNFSLFIDGVKEDNNTGNTAALTAPSSITVGAVDSSFDSTHSYNGTIDDLRMYSRALSDRQIQKIYQGNDFVILNPELNAGDNWTACVTPNDGIQDGTTVCSNTVLIRTPLTINLTYPPTLSTFQRLNTTAGEIPIRGNYTGTVSSIEASFNGGPYVVIDASPSNGVFRGALNASVGQGTLAVRFSDNTGINDSHADIGIGDVFVIAGQSNAVGFANYQTSLNASNRFNATVYKQTNTWAIANDPTGNNAGSAWPRLADFIIQNQSIPVAFITTAQGGTPITNWQKGNSEYDNMVGLIKNATNGTMRVKTMLFFQGERDAIGDLTTSEYNAYKNNLTDMAANFMNVTNIATTIIAGQIDSPQSGLSRDPLDIIRQAQHDAWNEAKNISAGPTTYDINQSPDHIHFSNYDEMRVLSNRWWASVRNTLYGLGNGRGPQLINITVTMPRNKTLIVSFNSSTPLIIRTWNDTTAVNAKGWRVIDGSTVLNDSNITSARIINNQVELNFSTSVSRSATLWLASGTDGYDQPVVRDSSDFTLPAETFFNVSPLFVNNTPASVSSVFINSTFGLNSTAENLTVFWTANNSNANITDWRLNGTSIAVLNMPFEGGSNSTFTQDYSTFRNNGIVSNAFWNSTGGYNGKGAYVFNGSVQGITLPENLTNLSNDHTFSAWIYALDNGTTHYSNIITREGKAAFMIHLGYLNYGFDFDWDNQCKYLFNQYLNTWTYVAATYNKAEARCHLFINGQEVNSSGKVINDITANLRIGQHIVDVFNGTIDEVRIYNRTLSSQQILALYNNRTDFISEKETSVGDNWTACVTPNDGTQDGASQCSNDIQIRGNATSIIAASPNQLGRTQPTFVATATPENWPMLLHDVSHTGTSSENYALDTSNLRQIANFSTGSGGFYASAAVVDGIIYVGSLNNNVFYALDAYTLQQIANFTAGNDFHESSAAVANGIVYVGAYDKLVYALNATTLQQIANFSTNKYIRSSPAVSNGIVYIGSDNTNISLYALNASNLVQLANFSDGSGNEIESSPAVSNGIVYIGSYDQRIYALNATTLVQLSNFTTGTGVTASPAVSNGIVYISSDKLYALNATNLSIQIANYTLDDTSYFSSPAVSNGIVYATGLKAISALNASNLAFIANFSIPGTVEANPAISNGVVYTAAYDNLVYAFNASNLFQLSNFTAATTFSSSPVVYDGTVYIGSTFDMFYALTLSPFTQLHNFSITKERGTNVTYNITATTNSSSVLSFTWFVDGLQIFTQMISGILGVFTGIFNYIFNDVALHNVTVVVNNSNSDDSFTFNLLSNDTIAPSLANISVSAITTSEANISWDASESANGSVSYGTDISLGSAVDSSSFTTSKTISLSGFSSGTLYYYNVTSCDQYRNCVVNGTFNFTTDTAQSSPGNSGGSGGGSSQTFFPPQIVSPSKIPLEEPSVPVVERPAPVVSPAIPATSAEIPPPVVQIEKPQGFSIINLLHLKTAVVALLFVLLLIGIVSRRHRKTAIVIPLAPSLPEEHPRYANVEAERRLNYLVVQIRSALRTGNKTDAAAYYSKFRQEYNDASALTRERFKAVAESVQKHAEEKLL